MSALVAPGCAQRPCCMPPAQQRLAFRRLPAAETRLLPGARALPRHRLAAAALGGEGAPSAGAESALRKLPALREAATGALQALVQAAEEAVVEAGETIVAAGSTAAHLTLLADGSCSSGDAPAVLGLEQLLLGTQSPASVVARTRCRLLRLDRRQFDRLSCEHPQLGLALYQQMAADLGATLQEEEANRHALQPYLLSAPRRGVVGESRYAKRLRRQVVEAARSRRPLLFYGEPGTEKTNCACLVHHGSAARHRPAALLDAGRLDSHGAELFGRERKAGLLELVGGGTLVLKNVHKLPERLLPRLVELLQHGTYERTRAAGPGGQLARRTAAARLLLTAQRPVPALEAVATVIKIAPLRVRPSDVVELQRYFARLIARRSGRPAMQLAPAALRRLQAYDFPGNVTELEAVMERAATQATAEQPVPAEAFWFASQEKDRFRLDLFAAFPWLRRLMRSRLWPDGINYQFTAYAYPAVVALLLWGPQDQGHNPALLVFWAGWWPIVFLLYPFLGRIWCSVCPFAVSGELVQRWRLARGAVLRKWPTQLAEAAGGWFLLALFAAILVWEEAWDLPNHAALSGWLLLLITAGAVACSAVFERRLWCRHLCPIGGMNAAFSKLAVTELRAARGVCAGSCSTYHCFKGGPAEPPDGLASPGCPLGSHPAHLATNADCVLCGECAKACPHGSVALRLRPPAADLTPAHAGRPPELALLLLLLGAVFLHSLPRLCDQLGLAPALLDDRGWHVAASLAVLAAPGAAVWAADAAARLLRPRLLRAGLAPPRPLLQAGYAYMPLVWAGTLAFYSRSLLLRGGTLLQVMAASVGLEGLAAALPAPQASEGGLHLAQAGLLLLGLGGSLLLLRRLRPAPLPGLMPQGLLMSAFTAEMWLLSL